MRKCSFSGTFPLRDVQNVSILMGRGGDAAHNNRHRRPTMTKQIDPLELLMILHENPNAFAEENAAIQAETEAKKAAYEAARDAADAAKKAAYAADGFFFNNVRRRYDCARCSGRGVLQQYRHVSGGVCFNCNGDAYRL